MTSAHLDGKQKREGCSLRIRLKGNLLGLKKWEVWGGEALINICIMQAKKTRSGEKIDHGGGNFLPPRSISAGKKLLSWADQHGQDQQGQDQRQQKEEKKERRGRSVKSTKSGKFARKGECSASEDKSGKPLGKVERTLSEDDLTKELLSLLGPPPKIHIPDSLDPSKVKQFLTLGVFSSPLLNRRTELDQDQLGRGEGLVAANVGKDSSDMRGRVVYSSNPWMPNNEFSWLCKCK